jgi:hypothetical protein
VGFLKKSLPMPAMPPGKIYREAAPVSNRLWLRSQDEGAAALEAQLGVWIQRVSENQELFLKHVYDNPDLSELDLRQHRARLVTMVSEGEWLALAHIEWADSLSREEEIQTAIKLIDQKNQELLKVLFQWHGQLENQPDIPDSFKQAVKENAEGKIAELDI